MLAAVSSAMLNGAAGRLVWVEVHVSDGLPGFAIVGLPVCLTLRCARRNQCVPPVTGL